MKVTALAKTAQDGDLTKRGAKPVSGRPDDDEKTGQRQAVHENTSAEERKKNQDTGYDITREMTEVKINREKITRKTKDKDGEDTAQTLPTSTGRERTKLAATGRSGRSRSTPARRAKSGIARVAGEKRTAVKVKPHFWKLGANNKLRGPMPGHTLTGTAQNKKEITKEGEIRNETREIAINRQAKEKQEAFERLKLLNSRSLRRGIQGLDNETKEETKISVLLPDKQIVKEEKEGKKTTEGKKQAVTKGNQKGKYFKNKQINTKKDENETMKDETKGKDPKIGRKNGGEDFNKEKQEMKGQAEEYVNSNSVGNKEIAMDVDNVTSPAAERV